MERAGHLPGGVISEVQNLDSQRTYLISTAPEIGEDFWTTGLYPIVERRWFFGLIKRKCIEFQCQIAAWQRNSQYEAYRVHGEVRGIVIFLSEADWFDTFPRPVPPDGYSDRAKARLRQVLGDDARIPD